MIAAPAEGTEFGNIWKALNSSAIVAITNSVGDIIHANDKICEISKYGKDELLGKNFRILNSGFHPPEFFATLWNTIKAGDIWSGEICNMTKTGELYWVYTSIVPCLDGQKHAYQFVVIRFEITHLKRVEALLAQSKEQLELKNKELSEFAFIAAHDIREPLRKMHTYADRLEQKLNSKLDEEERKYLQKVKTTATRMQTLVDDLLSYSQNSEINARPTVCKLSLILQEVLTDLEFKIEALQAKIDIGPLPDVHGDSAQIRHLFQNIIANALKFAKVGKSPQIEVSAEEDAEKVTLRFADSGIGFEMTQAGRIFDQFVRLNARHDYEGHGLGLSLCKRIVENHKGSIEVKSAPGVGSTFLITLPKTKSVTKSLKI